MAVFPARSLPEGDAAILRQPPGHPSRFAKQRGLVLHRQVQTQLHVFDDIAAVQFGVADDLPGESHPRSRQQAGQPQALQAQRADPVLDQKCQGGNQIPGAARMGCSNK